MKTQLNVGDLAKIDPGYTSGIWLRAEPSANISTENANVRCGVLLVLEVDNSLLSKDPSVKVVSEDGRAGWTFASRLVKV